jgi:protease I
MQPDAVAFAKAFFEAGKPVAAVCHGPWTVIQRAVADWRRGHRSRPIFAMQVRSGGIEKLSRTAISSRAASLTTFRPSTAE